MTAKKILQKQQEFFATGVTKSVHFRRLALRRLREAVRRWEPEILRALKADLNKSETESRMTETGMVLEEIRHLERYVGQWAKPHSRRACRTQLGGHNVSFAEPYGSVLILSPWNYPFQLNLIPLADAIAAGNCAVVKPSEMALQTAKVIQAMITECFPEKYVAVLDGGQPVSEALLEEPFDFIFFTGSQRVGKIVMEKASRHLTPVCLELGGKSPCIVDQTADLRLAAKRIAFGKLLNAGQTCVAPDYVLVQQDILEPFLPYLKYYFKKFLHHPNDYPKIVSPEHFSRLVRLLEGQNTVFGGVCKADTQQIFPTILRVDNPDVPVMQEEIFGPILPVLPFGHIRDAIAFVRARPKPLALYLFSQDPLHQACVLNRLSFGGGCINATILHITNPQIGFGGVGASGMGAYHGKAGFDLFSHEKNVFVKGRVDLPVAYPPYSKWKQAVIKKFFS